MNIKSFLPKSIVSKAFEYNSELSWRLADIEDLALVLKQNHVVVLGGEVWQVESGAPNIGSDIYNWSFREKNTEESWDSYVDNSLIEMGRFIKGLPEDKVNENTYINIQMLKNE